jgi:DNA-directed RNA polymerase subunit RPC12/RpoP
MESSTEVMVLTYQMDSGYHARIVAHTCEVNRMDDSINRQAAIEVLENIGSLDTESDRKYARSVFEGLPSAKPERETGYLILLDNCSNSGYYCSACHKKLVKEGWSDTVKKIKFCPNCGVKLVGVQI